MEVQEHKVAKSTASVWASLNKAHGGEEGGAFFRADEPMVMKIDTIDFPSVAMAAAIGIRGAPRGRITLFRGGEGSGKTFTALLQVVMAQREKGSEQVWVDAELQFNSDWAEMVGVDLSRLHIIKDSDGVQIMSQLCGRYNKDGKKNVDGVLDYAIRGDLNINLLVIDSIPSIQPPAESGRNPEDMEIAPLPKFLNRSLRFLRPMIAKSNTALVLINHIRENKDGGPPISPGGVGLRHNCDAILLFFASTAKDSRIVDANDKKLGHKVIMTVEKSRFGVNRAQTELWLDFTKGVAKLGQEVAEVGAAYGIISRPSTVSWVYGEHTAKGKDNFYALLETNVKLREEIMEKIYAKMSDGESPVIQLGESSQADAAAALKQVETT